MNALVIFCISGHNETNPVLNPSPRAVTSDKFVSDRLTTPRATLAVFNDSSKNAKGVYFKPTETTSVQTDDVFLSTRNHKSASRVTIPSTSGDGYTTEAMFDYLPKDQIPSLNSSGDMISCNMPCEQGVTVITSTVRSNSTERQEPKRGSRGIMNEIRNKLGISKNQPEDVAIQVGRSIH